jgi:hypothetical protein
VDRRTARGHVLPRLALLRKRATALLDGKSPAATVDAVNAAFFYGEEVPPAERGRTARWIAARRGLEGSYGAEM